MTQAVVDTAEEIHAFAGAAATAVIAVLPSSEPMEASGPTRDPRIAAALTGKAVSARFSGPSSGEVVIVISKNVVDALENSPLGALDLAQALRPALEAAAQVVGPVVLSPAQALDPAPALDALLAKPGSAIVPLIAGGMPMAAVGLVVTASAPENVPAAPQASVPSRTGPPAQSSAPAQSQPLARAGAFASSDLGAAGLDLLRGVEMDVTAELGRTRMSLHELLSLSDGAVIELDRAAGAPADLLVNGRLIARGEVVVIDESFGLRITEIVSDGAAR